MINKVRKCFEQIAEVHSPSGLLRRILIMTCSLELILSLFGKHSKIRMNSIHSHTKYLVAAYLPMYIMIAMSLSKYESFAVRVS